ncbi:MAG TPA: hypothetical protein VFJ16_21305 [Longimicrobium sp.]|nr:hypothetical protein [Longimicrobium sp.]
MSKNPQDADNQAHAETELRELEGDVLEHLNDDTHPFASHLAAGGCFTIIGPVQVCWEVVGSNQLKVCLKLAGISVGCVTVAIGGQCQKLEGKVDNIAKASVEVCLKQQSGKWCLTFSGQVCIYVPFSWKCYSKSGTIVCL